MTLINSCCPKSFSHLIFILSMFTITATTTQLEPKATRDHSAAIAEAAVNGYDRKNDNKRYDNLFDFKTDVNNLLFHHNHGNLPPSAISRKRRDAAIQSPLENESMALEKMPSNESLILDLSFSNLTYFNVNLTRSIGDSVSLLNLSHNFLTAFNAKQFHNLTKLKALDLSHNNISECNLDECQLLRALNLSGNSLVSFEYCGSCESLETLDVSHNKLTTLTLTNLTNLKFMDMSCNELNAIDAGWLRNKSNLTDVIMACNRINVINKDLFSQLKSLRRLDLSHNDISDIDSETFNDLLNLQILDLSFNRIHVTSLQALQSIVDLTRLSVAGNEMLRNALRGFAVTWSIMELDYSHVGLCQVPDSLSQSVRILNLYGNFVNIICSGDFESYPLLHKLVLSYNNMTSIEDDALGRLEMLTILHLDNNQLLQIPSSLPASLVKLYVQHNRLTEINSDDFIHLINLQVLDVSENRIIYMPQLQLPSLITLNVRACGLENIHRLILKTCPNLRHLLIYGNLIKCSQLMALEQKCNENSEALTNEYINDDIDYNQDDVERKERHLNSISHFHNDGGLGRCWDETTTTNDTNEGAVMPTKQTETVPNCWNEQKLITSFISTNDSTTSTIPPSAASSDNKFQQNTSAATKDKSDVSLSKTTMNINNNNTRKIDDKLMVVGTDGTMPSNWQTSVKGEKMKNSGESKKVKLMKAGKLPVFPVNVVKMKIKTLRNDGTASSTSGNNKNLSLGSVDAHKQKGLNNLILMKTKQIKIENASNRAPVKSSGSPDNNIEIHSNYHEANQTNTFNGNLIDFVNADYRKAQSLSSKSTNTQSLSKIKGIRDNERSTTSRTSTYNSRNSTNNRKSMSPVNIWPHLNDNNTSRNVHNNSVNGPSLATESMPKGNMSGNESIDATDQQHHMPINHMMNGEQSEQWNDVRNETISHPGLLVVFVGVSIGTLLTFIVVYVYRCNFIKSARRQRGYGGSCETINEGRDVLNDNFNEEIQSFTIETHNHCPSSPLTEQSTVNHCDLLPMDILNSTISQSVDRSNISMHLW